MLPFLPRLLSRQRSGDVTERLAYFDLLTVLDRELEVRGGLEDEHNRAPEAEAAHLLRGRERLAVEQRRGGGVDRFGVCARGRGATAFVRTEGLV